MALLVGDFLKNAVLFEGVNRVIGRRSGDTQHLLNVVRGQVRLLEEFHRQPCVGSLAVAVGFLVALLEVVEFERPLVGLSSLLSQSREEELEPRLPRAIPADRSRPLDVGPPVPIEVLLR